MRYVLDTNVICELRKPKGYSSAAVRGWIDTQSRWDLSISVVSLFEIERGIGLLARRDTVQAEHMRTWLDRVLGEFEGRLLNLDGPTLREAARLHVPDPRPHWDSLIAASAAVHGLTVVTRNVRDFVSMGVPVLNPWDET